MDCLSLESFGIICELDQREFWCPPYIEEDKQKFLHPFSHYVCHTFCNMNSCISVERLCEMVFLASVLPDISCSGVTIERTV